MVKKLPANTGGAGDLGSIPGFGKIPWGRKWQAIPVFLPGESHGERNLVGYSPWGCKQLDLTEHTYKPSVLSCHNYSFVFIKSTNMTMILVDSHLLMVSKMRDYET